MNDVNYTPLKVAAKTHPNSLAGAITKTLQEGHPVAVTAIGADAVNQMCKAEIVANSFLAPSGKRLDITPAFGSISSAEKPEVTTITHYLTTRSL